MPATAGSARADRYIVDLGGVDRIEVLPDRSSGGSSPDLDRVVVRRQNTPIGLIKGSIRSDGISGKQTVTGFVSPEDFHLIYHLLQAERPVVFRWRSDEEDESQLRSFRVQSGIEPVGEGLDADSA